MTGQFLKVVEVFPPFFTKGMKVDIEESVERFVSGAAPLTGVADLVMVADLKDTSVLKLSAVRAAALLHARLGVRSMPVLVARDLNRPAFETSVITALAEGIDALMVAWGDRFARSDNARMVYDFGSLSDAILLVRRMAARAGKRVTVFAPLRLTAHGAKLGRSRLKAGADFLLAQPPTTGPVELRRDVALLKRWGLNDKTLLGVFPFRSLQDVRETGRRFRWDLPLDLKRAARGGGDVLTARAKSVVSLAREDGARGVYVSTRGDPGFALEALR